MKYYCGNCGAKVSDNARFCPKCGAELGEVEVEEDDKKQESGFLPRLISLI